MTKNILLTGSGGFIGKNLKTHLQKEYNLLCPRSYKLNLTNPKEVENYFRTNTIDFIIHCATVGGAREIADKDTTIQDNLKMVNNLINAKKNDVKIILFGSGAMYGKDRNLHKVKEADIGSYIPKDLYGQSKLEISKIVKKRNDILMLNIFACYGYGELETRLPSYAINQNLQHLPIEINQNVIFDYLWVEDMVKIVDYFIKNQSRDKIINITPSVSCDLETIAKTVNEISDYKSKIIIKNKNLNYEYTGNNELLLNNIPNIEFTELKEGLKKLFEYKRLNNE